MDKKFLRLCGVLIGIFSLILAIRSSLLAHGPTATAVMEYDDLVACVSGVKVKFFRAGEVPHIYTRHSKRKHWYKKYLYEEVREIDPKELLTQRSLRKLNKHRSSKIAEYKYSAIPLNQDARYIEILECPYCHSITWVDHHVKAGSEYWERGLHEIVQGWSTPCPSSKEQRIDRFWIPVDAEERLWSNLRTSTWDPVNYKRCRIRDQKSLDNWRAKFPDLLRRATEYDVESQQPDVGDYVYTNVKAKTPC